MFKFLLTYLLACPCCPPFSLEAMFAESENLFIGKIKTVQLFYPNYLIHTKKEADEKAKALAKSLGGDILNSEKTEVKIE